MRLLDKWESKWQFFMQRVDNSWANNNPILQQESRPSLKSQLSQVSLPVLSIWSGQWRPGSSWPFLPASFPHHQGDKIVYISSLASFLIFTSIIQKKKKVSTCFVLTFPFYFSHTSSRIFPHLGSSLTFFPASFPVPFFPSFFSHHPVLFLFFLPLTHLTSPTSRRFQCLFFLFSPTLHNFQEIPPVPIFLWEALKKTLNLWPGSAGLW